ncbi:MAG: 30S ribosomal protein S6 [Clostridia bacterium]|nr:30S ribosomal protein S6 [Clostridia bacterium]MDD4047397.1 30S ribosomal protein S6 [Clostridia bacterium]
MRDYEMVVIVKTNLEEEATNAVIEKITNLINNNGGELAKIDKWGKRRLAYEINDLAEGIYYLVNFKGIPETVKEIDRVLKITDEVIRFMIIRKDD